MEKKNNGICGLQDNTIEDINWMKEAYNRSSKTQKKCICCGWVDEYYDENCNIDHEDTPKHLCNVILMNYNNNKEYFSSNKDGVLIFGYATTIDLNNKSSTSTKLSDHHKIRAFIKPEHRIRYAFNITNDMKKEDLLIIGVQLAHPQSQFREINNPYIFGGEPKKIAKKTTIQDAVIIEFEAEDLGQYEMPIVFTLYRESDKKNLIYVREMVAHVDTGLDNNELHAPRAKYCKEAWIGTTTLYSTSVTPYEVSYKIPKLLKKVLAVGLEPEALDKLKETVEVKAQLRILQTQVRQIFDTKYTKGNYVQFFHHLLWWEEIINRINLRNYNMKDVQIGVRGHHYLLEVPGLAEKRPSLLRGDRVYIRPKHAPDSVFESQVDEIEDNVVLLRGLDASFQNRHSSDALFDIRFLMSRVPLERMHDAVHNVFESGQDHLIFPEPNKRKVQVKKIDRFFNPLIMKNPEQRSAVEHIIAESSGKAPYIVWGPPGTGKTMTIVEAIIQLVARNANNRVMVCTDSNMAADHIALALLQYDKQLNIKNFLLRASSRTRDWSVMPAALAAVSNGTSYEKYTSVDNDYVAQYRVFVTTLSHAAKYSSRGKHGVRALQMSHLFVDEAAQASEPAVLVPASALLARGARLVLAGDPQQLGPVCGSRDAARLGLGQSLMERLRTTYDSMYNSDPNYITMLVNNFRSDPDILAIPNTLFYENNLKPMAPLDPLSNISILGLAGGDGAVIFHGVHSREQRIGKTPSFFNDKEVQMVAKYIEALLEKHGVLQQDIGIIAPYIRQVYKIKNWLKSKQISGIEVGTVESFQGKEKRVVVVSTVRANCRLLEFDARYGLGFLVDDKRYNVTLTRAKAKLIIIGNPTCLVRDVKWRIYMDFCKQNNCYHGQETEQLERNSIILQEIAQYRMKRCRLAEELRKPKK